MPNKQDDLDDILSGIMRGDDKPKLQTPPPSSPSKQPAPVKTSSQAPQPQKKPRKKRGKKLFLGLIILLLLGGAIAAGVLYGPKIVDKYLYPSPFSEDLKDSVDISLYYPNSLPENFKLETDSIEKAEDNVVIYAISDDDKRRVVVTVQKTPENPELTLEPFYAKLNDVYDLDTPVGKAKIGKDNGALFGNIVNDKEWIIITTPNKNVSTEQLNSILQNFKKDE